MEKSVLREFIKYVSLNVMGMIGLSCYILADTFFIAKALGANGITALNFSISVYSFIHGIGLMIAIGGATRYTILKSQGKDNEANMTFTTCVKLGIFTGIVFIIVGILRSETLALILGADTSTLPLTKTYLTTILCFSPFFIMNNIMLAFVRNDNNPKLPMVAMLTGSFSNILLDYIFMFPLRMGMFGAAFATCLAPIINIVILFRHFVGERNSLKYTRSRIILSSLLDILSLGLSAFIAEVSSAIVLITFNLVILSIEGNLGVAAYGIIANIALVILAIFTGIAQGVQPLVSKGHGLKNHNELKKVVKYALLTSFSLALITYISMFRHVESIIEIFNSQHISEIAGIAKTGFKIYFGGFFFAGINIILTMYFSATEHAKEAFILSISRGCIVIVPMVLLLSRIWNMKGVWFSFVFTEFIVTVMAIFIAISGKKTSNALKS